jgi:AraC-like DNA-binding protein
MVKIGMTTSTPDARAKEISSATGVAVPWIPVYWFKCYRSDLLEAEVHDYFKEYRVNHKREMFEIDSYTAQRVIEDLGYKYSTALWEHNRL